MIILHYMEIKMRVKEKLFMRLLLLKSHHLLVVEKVDLHHILLEEVDLVSDLKNKFMVKVNNKFLLMKNKKKKENKLKKMNKFKKKNEQHTYIYIKFNIF